MSPITAMPQSLPSIDVSGARKDVKAPRYLNRELQWIYGMWLARGGTNQRGIYLSIPKNRPDIINEITTVAFYQFNLNVKLIDHSAGKYRMYFNSRSIKQWWDKLHIEPNPNTGIGILDASSWSKSSHLIVTCTREKTSILLPHLAMIHEDIEERYRENKNSCDIYLLGFLDKD